MKNVYFQTHRSTINIYVELGTGMNGNFKYSMNVVKARVQVQHIMNKYKSYLISDFWAEKSNFCGEKSCQ